MKSDDRDSRGEREAPSSSSGTSEPSRPGPADGRNGGESAEAGSSTPTEAEPAPAPPPHYDDPPEKESPPEKEPAALAKREPALPAPPPPPPPSSAGGGDDGDEDEGMARMSFLEHLEELRTRLIRSLQGLVVVYAGCLVFAQELFVFIRDPFDQAVAELPEGSVAHMVQLTATETFQLLYLKVPLLAAVFIASPWLMYQAWAFIAPGLYKRERRWALPFIFSTAGLFILGGIFGYFVALRFALAFLVGIGQDLGIQAMIGVNSYFDTFVGIMLGLGIVFQMPILIFFLTLLRISSPGFLLSNVRYAILIIFILAAVITPTPDVVNMLIFAVPMILLFYVGIGASYLLVLKRENRSLPWGRIIFAVLAVLAGIAGIFYYMHFELGYQFVREAPFFVPPGN